MNKYLITAALAAAVIAAPPVAVPFLAGDAVAAVPTRPAEKVFKFHGHERHGVNAFWAYVHDGRLDRDSGKYSFRAETRTFEFLRGFRGGVQVEFFEGVKNAKGKITRGDRIWTVYGPIMGVDGEANIFHTSQRFASVEGRIPKEAAARVMYAEINLVQKTPTPRDQLKKNLDDLKKVLQDAADFVGDLVKILAGIAK